MLLVEKESVAENSELYGTRHGQRLKRLNVLCGD